MTSAASASVASGPLVLPFAEIRDEHLALVGAKARSLGELRAAGLPVPDGFCLTTAAMWAFIDEGGIRDKLEPIERRARAGDLPLAESWAYLGETRKHMTAAALPERIRGPLLDAYAARLGSAAVAVRSSGTKEDLADASFAGQYETYLGVRGVAALEDAVKKCWSSLWRNRVLQYAARKGGGVDDLALCVVVQRLVEAETAGVLFTVNPLTGRDGDMLVEACFGLGEALVSGKVNPDSFVVERETGRVLERRIAEKKVKVVAREGGAAEVEVEGGARTAPTLADADLAALASLARDVQAHYGRPMDVEWARDAAGATHLVQARPITKLNFAASVGEWTTADFRDGGVSSDVCSPFMASLYEWIFEETMTAYLRDLRLLGRDEAPPDWFRVFFARPYWNMGAVKGVLARVPGFVERTFDRDLGIEPTYEGDGIRTPVTIGGVLGALPVLFALKRAYRRRLEENRAFVAAFDGRARVFEEAPFAGPTYRRLIEELYHDTESAYFHTIYNTSNSKLDFKTVFDKVNRRAGGKVSYLNLILGLRDLSHLRPLRDLHAIARDVRRDATGREPRLASFRAKWGYHGRKELDITVPRWGEEPETVAEMLDRAVETFDEASDPETLTERQHAQYEAERAAALAALGWRPFLARSFRAGLELVRSYAWWREEMRDRSTRAYALVRRFTLEAARRLVSGEKLAVEDDVWFLSFRQVLDLVDGRLPAEAAAAAVASGRRGVRSFRRFKNPSEIGARHRFVQKAKGAPGAKRLAGVACSPGRVRGRARIVRSLEEGKRVAKGDILVTVFTDPGWTPLLGLVSAVVTETGGLLSHAAVISREYGIPAVLAVAGATDGIRDGEEIEVDGGEGVVELGGGGTPAG